MGDMRSQLPHRSQTFVSSLVSRFLRWTQRFAGHPIYPGIAGVIAALDYLVPGAPTNAFLVASVLPRPSQWRRLGVAFAIGDALGALLLASAIAVVGGPVIAWIQGSEAADLWIRIAGYVDAYGLLTLAALAVSPFPARIATAILALAGTPLALIGGTVLLGRLVAYPTLAVLAARVPSLLLRIRPLARWVQHHQEQLRVGQSPPDQHPPDQSPRRPSPSSSSSNLS